MIGNEGNTLACHHVPPVSVTQLAALPGSYRRTRINTLGDRAEDVLLVSDETLANPEEVLRLEKELLTELQI